MKMSMFELFDSKIEFQQPKSKYLDLGGCRCFVTALRNDASLSESKVCVTKQCR